MIRTANWLGLALTLAPWPALEPLKVTTSASPRPCFVGQGVEVRVEVEPPSPSTTVDAPRIAGAEVFAIPPEPARPSAGRFVVVPGRAGPLELPSFRARSGERSGASRPGRMAVAGVPPEGRTSAFLGGVGPFEVRAGVGSTDVRPGQTLDFRVEVSGPAAWGSVRAPNLDGWNSPTLRVEAPASSFRTDATPTRTFLYRVRLLKSGKVVLPPVAVAAFDPTTRRYATKATSGVAIRVEEPPGFDPSRLDYGPVATPGRRSPGTLGRWVAVPAVAMGSALAAWLVARRWRKSRAIDPIRLALGLARTLEAVDDELEAARAVAEALTTFLHRAWGRPSGALTPPEARAGFERLADNPGLAARAEALVARCDRARYGRVGGEASGLIEEARRFFEDLAVVMGKGRGPGEAVETASDR